jgi:hypothetical protein
MSLIRVYTDVGGEDYVSLYARIIKKTGDVFTIKYLSPMEHHSGQTIYRYETDTYEITDENVSRYLDVDDEHQIGFKKFDEDSWVRVSEEDEDYEPNSDEEDEEEEDDEEEVDYDDEENEFYDDEEDYDDN